MEESHKNATSFVVPKGIIRERADKVLAAHFTSFSRVQIQRTFEEGNVLRNGKSIDKKTALSEDEVIEIIFLEPKATEINPVDIPLEILYEDDDILAINKTIGMVVHPGSGTGEDTMVHAVLHYTKGKLSLAGGKERPGVVHRLDKETTGVILFAKTDVAYFQLIKMFTERQVDKEYLALVAGIPRLKSGSIKTAIGRDPRVRIRMAVTEKGRPAHTDWVLEKAFCASALLRCYLHTGRTHQIRVHLASINHPILGDALYGYRFRKDEKEQVSRVMLHAERISFEHPVTKKATEIVAPLPEDFKDYMSKF